MRKFDSDASEAQILLVPDSESESQIRLLDKIDLQAEIPVKSVLEHDRLFWLMKLLMIDNDLMLNQVTVSTVEYKWLRAVPTGKFTGLHTGTNTRIR